MEMKDMTLVQFCEQTASSASVPGGGSVSALSGALAAALAGMVAALTIGKKGYEERTDAMQKLSEEADDLRRTLLADIQRDCTSFHAFMLALALPKETEEQKSVRRETMQSALKAAAQVPFEIAQTALRVMPLAKNAVLYGNSSAVTDGLVAAMMSRTAVLSALYNVKINLASIKDADYVCDMTARVKALEEQAIACEAEIIGISPF